VGEEAVTPSDGVGVGGFYAIGAGQGGDQHEQGRARRVELVKSRSVARSRWPDEVRNRVEPANGCTSPHRRLNDLKDKIAE